MEDQTQKAVLRVSFDVFCIACVAFPVLILFFTATPYQRGFYCDDESLMHPYKSNTIPTWVAGFVGILLPSICILTIEGAKIFRDKKSKITFFVECYKLFMPFFFGAGLCQLTTDIAKYTVGRLRPHFLTVCKPSITCNFNMGFIEGDVCTGDDKAAIDEARLSFPSGHSSIAFYCMIWLMVYLQFKFEWKKFWLIRPVLQAVSFFLAYYCALSRISDYMHHWSDVLAGSIIGTIVALLDIFFMSNLLPSRRRACNSCRNILPLHNTNQASDNDRLAV